MENDLVFSGIQPTGNLHLGNYLGAIKPWIKLQNQFPCLFCIVDSHAITTSYSPDRLRENVRLTLATYLACGIDPEKSIIFIQSSVPEHAELCWALSCITPIGHINRMTQFKDKAGKNKEKASLGLYSYPVLMAADILIYKATKVPVGEDQKQHLELTRDIAQRFNERVGCEYFTLPDPLINEDTGRIMSLRDEKAKMSKSDPSELSRINLTDSANDIRNKIRKAVTDSLPHLEYESLEGRPGVKNLVNIYTHITDLNIESVCKKFNGRNFAEFKNDLADLLVEELTPISKKIDDILSREDYLDNLIKDGAKRARMIAKANKQEIYKLMGLL